MTDQQLNEYIDKIYDLFKKSDSIVNNDILLFVIREPDLVRLSHTDTILLRMQEFGLVQGSNVGTVDQTWQLTQLGRKVLRFGSWTKYLKHQHDKEVNDANISEWMIKTKWLPHGLSGAAILISVFSLIVSIRQCQQGQVNEPKIESGIQYEHSNPTTQPTLDSLQNVGQDSVSYQK